MKFTVKTTGNWAEVKEFETLKEALQEFEAVAQGNFHYYIAKGVAEPYTITLEVETEDGTKIFELTPTQFKGTSVHLGRNYLEIVDNKDDGEVKIYHYNSQTHYGSKIYEVQYDC